MLFREVVITDESSRYRAKGSEEESVRRLQRDVDRVVFSGGGRGVTKITRVLGAERNFLRKLQPSCRDRNPSPK